MFRASLAALTILTMFVMAWVPAQARVFNPNSESFSAYVLGTWGPSFENTLSSESNTVSSVPVTVNAKHPYNLSGEFGFVYAHPALNVRIGLEVIRPSQIQDAKASDANGTALYNQVNEITVLVPKFALEFNLHNYSEGRVFLEGGVGYANLAGRNSYTFTSAGNTAYPGMADFYEDLRANAMFYEGSLAYERLLNDMTTYVLHAGYRSLKFDEIKHNRDVTTFQGAVTKGQLATNADGSNRALDLSNYFVGISFRFWIH